MGASLEVAAIAQEGNYAVLDRIAGVREEEMETKLVELIDFSDHGDVRGDKKEDGLLGFWF